MTDILYRENRADFAAVADHFKSCDSVFQAELMSRVDMKTYIEKLLDRAIRFEAWSGGILAGFVACYSNKDFAFITNVSVAAEFTSQGIATKLLSQCIDAGRADGKTLRLEVAPENAIAIALYRRLGFTQTGENAQTGFKIYEIS